MIDSYVQFELPDLFYFPRTILLSFLRLGFQDIGLWETLVRLSWPLDTSNHEFFDVNAIAAPLESSSRTC